MKSVILFFILCFMVASAFANTLEIVIAPPQHMPVAGEELIFSVYFHNPGAEEHTIRIPDSLACSLKTGSQDIRISAVLQTGPPEPETILANGYVKVRYAMHLPEKVVGIIQLTVPELEAARVLFPVEPSKPLSNTGIESKDSIAQQKKSLSVKTLFSLYQPYLGKIAAHEPMYFLGGANPEESKFQISVKYRFINPDSLLAEKHPWVKGFHFGYTQTSFWDLGSTSAPFKDTSYKPELFFVSPAMETGFGFNDWLYVQSGFQHESNGRGSVDSRSTNTIYLKPAFISYDNVNRWGLMVTPRIWAYIHNADDTNPDLSDYRGYFDLEVLLGKPKSYVLGSHFRWAKKGASVQLDMTYPLHRVLKSFDIYLQVQYANALAESLLNYTDRTEAFRIGFALSR